VDVIGCRLHDYDQRLHPVHTFLRRQRRVRTHWRLCFLEIPAAGGMRPLQPGVETPEPATISLPGTPSGAALEYEPHVCALVERLELMGEAKKAAVPTGLGESFC